MSTPRPLITPAEGARIAALIRKAQEQAIRDVRAVGEHMQRAIAELRQP